MAEKITFSDKLKFDIQEDYDRVFNKLNNLEEFNQIDENEYEGNVLHESKDIQEMDEIENEASQQASQSNNNIVSNMNESRIQTIKDFIEEKCSKIFYNFAILNKNDKKFYLSQQNLLKILKEINIVDEKAIISNEIDVIFKKVSGSGKRLSLSQFSSVILLVSRKIDPQKFLADPKAQVISVIKNFFEPYSKFIEGKNENDDINDLDSSMNTLFLSNTIEKFFKNFVFESKILSIFSSIYNGIKSVYTIYFPHEINSNTIFTKKADDYSFESAVEWAKDFEIIPSFCNINQLRMCYEYLIKLKDNESFLETLLDNKKNYGKIFTLGKFLAFILYCSITSYFKYNLNIKNDILNEEKILSFLEKLQNSKGLMNINKKTGKFHTSDIYLLPDNNILTLIKPENNKTYNFLDTSTKQDNLSRIRDYNEKTKNGLNETNCLRDLLTIIPEAFMKLEKELENLKEIFTFYCSFNNTSNNCKMNYTSYLKFLRDCEFVYDESKYQQIKRENESLNIKKNEKEKNNKNQYNLDFLKEPCETVFKSGNIHKKSLPKGKILESDCLVIFYELTGNKNFDQSEKIKTHFDKNAGFAVNLENNSNFLKSESNKESKVKSNVALKLDFCLFIKSFEMLGPKLYPNENIDSAFNTIIDKDIAKIMKNQNFCLKTKKKRKNNQIWNYLKRDNIVDLFQDIHPLIFPYYEHYCKNDILMNYETFFDFYKDFLIFPDLINISSLKTLFFSLSDIFAENREDLDENSDAEIEKVKKCLNSNKYINYDLFIESLGVTACKIKNVRNLNEVERILYLLERMNASEAIKKCKIKTGQLFYNSKDAIFHKNELKRKYNDFYNKKLQNSKNSLDFEKMLI